MKLKIFNTKCSNTEKLFVIFLGISLFLLTFKFLTLPQISVLNILAFVLLFSIFCALVFLAYVDYKKMEVHNTVSLILMIFLLSINILLFLIKGSDTAVEIFNNWTFSPYQNIISTLILGSIFQLIVLISKEKALGQGDVRIAIITGLLIGYTNLIVWAYITVFTSIIYGLVFAYLKKKEIKGLRIPLVPFMVVGIVLTILFFL